MMNTGLSASDVALLSGSNNRSDGFGWGGEGGWLWIIVVFALLFGWGGNGFGGFGGNNGGGYVATAATQADIQRGFDNQAVISKLDGITNGLCDGFYAVNNGMLTGFNGINTNVMQTGFGIQQAINADTIANMQNTNALQAQLANCCCETREAIQGVNYNLATQACDTRQTIQNGTRDIIENQNANARAVLDALTAQRIEAKDAKIAEQNQQLFAAQLAASQAAQNSYLLNQLRPVPVPAYQSCNPWAAGTYNGCNGCAC